MRTLIIAAVAAGTTLCAIPAAAQTTGAPCHWSHHLTRPVRLLSLSHYL